MSNIADAYIELLGLYGTDRVTGLQGVICNVSFDLYGCVQVILRPRVDKDNKLVDAHFFDVARIDVDRSVARVMPVPAFAAVPHDHAHGPSEKPAPSAA